MSQPESNFLSDFGPLIAIIVAIGAAFAGNLRFFWLWFSSLKKDCERSIDNLKKIVDEDHEYILQQKGREAERDRVAMTDFKKVVDEVKGQLRG